MIWLIVPVTSKKGEALDNHLINLSNVLYFREWFENKPLTDTYLGKTVAYVIGGKEVVIDLPLYKVNEIVIKREQEYRHNIVLEGVKETDKETA